ncbi:MAG: hypothetical protein V4538_01545 [Bacteroidota bacterium]
MPTPAGQIIDKELGAEYTANYRATGETTLAQVVDVDLIKTLINQEGAKYLRMYYALKDGKKTLVIVAADASENDMLDVVVDDTWTCPPHCGAANILNGL